MNGLNYRLDLVVFICSLCQRKDNTSLGSLTVAMTWTQKLAVAVEAIAVMTLLNSAVKLTSYQLTRFHKSKHFLFNPL